MAQLKLKHKLAAGGAAVGLAVTLIAGAEGLRTKAYPDPEYGWDVPTYCYGHTKGVKQGDVATADQCKDILQADVIERAGEVEAVVHVPMTDGEEAAYISFVFNVGLPAFSTSTMLQKLNAGDHIGACNELPRWVYAGRDILRGLVVRRAHEQAMCLRDLVKVTP